MEFSTENSHLDQDTYVAGRGLEDMQVAHKQISAARGGRHYQQMISVPSSCYLTKSGLNFEFRSSCHQDGRDGGNTLVDYILIVFGSNIFS